MTAPAHADDQPLPAHALLEDPREDFDTLTGMRSREIARWIVAHQRASY